MKPLTNPKQNKTNTFPETLSEGEDQITDEFEITKLSL